MPSRLRLSVKPRAVFLFAFGSLLLVLSVLYFLSKGQAGAINSPALLWLLYPGLALYTFLNGSFLFGGGFGGAGDFAVIVVGSAVAWASLCVLLQLVLAAMGHTRR